MNVTLKKMFEAAAQKETCFFAFKKKLLAWKKEGVAFFSEDLSVLTENSTIDFYFHATPSKHSLPKAFPIPTRHYLKHRTTTDQFEFVKAYYAAYYSVDELTPEEYLTYEPAPFCGEKFVWYFKKH